MTPEGPLDQLLRDFAAAEAAGVRRDGPTPTERARVDAEIEQWLRPAPSAAPRRWRVRRWVGAAAAAALVIAAGWWVWQSLREPKDSTVNSGEKPHALLHGRGRVVPVTDQTRFSVADADSGRVHLERGEIYVEMPHDPSLSARVETLAGVARASGTRFYVHYDHPAHAEAPVLAVVSLAGSVEVTNPHGRVIGDAGEVILAEATGAPERHSSAAPPSHLHGVCPYTSALGLVYRPEVQEELGLSPVQKSALQRPGADELKEICEFFRGLRALPRDQWSARTSAFCDVQRNRLAEVLTADQQKRLREISLQQEGPFAVARTEIAKELELTEEQRTGVQGVLKEYTDGYHAVAARGLAAADMIREVSELQQQASVRLLALLSEAQRLQWREMTGKSFSLKARM